MLQFIYPISFLASLTGGILWFYFQHDRRRSRQMSLLFLVGFFVYLFSLAFADADFSYKLLTLIRDLVILGLVSQFFGVFKQNKTLFFGLLALLYAGVLGWGYEKLEQTFPQEKAIEVERISELAADGELLVQMDRTAGAEAESAWKAFQEKYALQSRMAFDPAHPATTELDDYLLVDVPESALVDLETIVAELKKLPGVDWVEENEVIQIAPIEAKLPTKTERKFGINDPGVEQLWGFEKMNVDQLYQFLRKGSVVPKKKALIAILDTGIDAKHEDIAANYRSTQEKYDRDMKGHGTHCAGIAAAVSNNGIGIASFSPDNELVEVTSVTVLSRYGSGTQSSIVKGMIEATDKGADVISMSLGGRGTAVNQRAYNQAITYATEAGVIVVAAAGNSNSNTAGFVPAGLPGVLCVTAVDPEGNRASFSNYSTGDEMVVAAPGVNIYSTFPGNKYRIQNGTSMAAPYVSGLVGVMRSLNPDLTTREVYDILNETGIPTGDTERTGKLIHPVKAVEKVLK